MKIIINVPCNRAIMSGNSRYGVGEIEITDAMLAEITQVERKMLLHHIQNTKNGTYHTYYGDPNQFGIGFDCQYTPAEYTWAEVKKSIVTEVAHEVAMAAQLEADTLAWLEKSHEINEVTRSVKHADSAFAAQYTCIEYLTRNSYKYDKDDRVKVRLAEIKVQEQELNAEREATALEHSLHLQMEADQQKAATVEAETKAKEAVEKEIGAWLQSHAPQLVPRYQEHLLPETELIHAVSEHVFQKFNFNLFTPIEIHEIRCDCCDYDSPDKSQDPTWVERKCEALSEGEYQIYQKIKEVAEEENMEMEVALQTQAAYCSLCFHRDKYDGEVTRNSVLLKITWHGLEISQEYALD